MNLSILITSMFQRRGFNEAEQARKQLSNPMISQSGPLLGSTTAARQFSESAAKASDKATELAGKVNGVNRALHATEALARGDIFGAMSQAASALATRFARLGGILASGIGGLLAGWQIGSLISDLTGLGRALDRLLVPPPLIAKSIRTMANERLAGLQAELQTVKDRLESLAADAEKAAARIATVLEHRAANRAQEGLKAELAAAPEDRPVVAAKNKLDASTDNVAIADARKGEAEKAAAIATSELSAMRKRLADAETNLANSSQTEANRQLQASIAKTEALRKELQATEGMADEYGTGSPVDTSRLNKQILAEEAKQQELKVTILADTVSAQDAVKTLRAQLDAVIEQETAAKQRLLAAETAVTNATTDQIKAQNDLETATKSADAARMQSAANAQMVALIAASDAKAARDKVEFDNASPERQAELLKAKMQSVDAEAGGAAGPVNPARLDELAVERATLAKQVQDVENKVAVKAQAAAAEQAQTLGTQARDQAQFADQAATAAAAARGRVLDTHAAREADRAEARKKSDKTRDDKRISSMLRQAKAAGYEARQGPGGLFDAVKTGHMGPISKRLAEAVIADAKAKFAEQQKAEADRLDREAKEAAVKSKKLLEDIARNTAAGPVA
jgi:hypothetical protein